MSHFWTFRGSKTCYISTMIVAQFGNLLRNFFGNYYVRQCSGNCVVFFVVERSNKLITLKKGDCLELMKDIPDGSIDLTVTSPPYDNLRSYNGNNDSWNQSVWKSVIEELCRVTKDGGVVVWIVGDATVKGSETGTSFKQALYFKEVGFNIHDTMIYLKANPIPNAKTLRYTQSFEYMFVLSKGKPNVCNYLTDVSKTAGKQNTTKNRLPSGEMVVGTNFGKLTRPTKIRKNVWEYAVGLGGTTNDRFAFQHPAMFPEKLAEDHIISWSNGGDTVLDPFMGSGTTAKMAMLNNRNFIGYELDGEYFEIAKERIEKALK